MPLKCGIVGLPNVGKSTLFNALTNANALAANFPFATKDPNVGIITVPDRRLDQLTQIVQPKKMVPTTVEIVDIAGLIKGASKGEGLGNQFLANIREVDAIIHVIRCFDDDNVVHVDGNVDPIRDREIIDTELLLKDMETVEKRLEKLRKMAKSGQKEDRQAADNAAALLTELERGLPARKLKTIQPELFEFSKDLFLLSAKPIMFVCNVDENSVVNGNTYTSALIDSKENENAEIILVSAAIEAEIASLSEVDEQKEFLEEMGLKESGLRRVIRSSYSLLNLITFFTAGPKEVHAWTVVNGTKTPRAAGTIHTDFEKGFIRAEVIKAADFIECGSEAKAKEKGKMSVEGKEYIVRDGDVIYFRFNV